MKQLRNSPWRSLLACAALLLAPLPGISADPQPQTVSRMSFQLPDNAWRQIGLPLAPVSNATLNDVLGDDLPPAEYGSRWVVYSYDGPNNRYARLDLGDALEQGVGYWILQRTGSTVTLDIDGVAAPLASPTPQACPAEAPGCFSISLTTAANGHWHMAGYPFANDLQWRQQVVSTNSGPCAGQPGCAPAAASDAGVFYRAGYHFNGETYDVLEDAAPLSAWRGYWVATLPGAQGKSPVMLLPAFGDPSSPVGFNEEQHRIADQIISIFENGTTEIQYGYAEHIVDDQHGITAGRAGFTSATGDMLMVVERYAQRRPGNPLAQYIPELQRLEQVYIDHDYELSEEGASVENLGGLIPAWRNAAEDPVFRAVQDEVTDELYFNPVLNKAREIGIHHPLTLLCMYDAAIQHGYEGMLEIMNRTTEPAPADGGDEPAWLQAFNNIRLDVMKNTVVDGERIWADTLYRQHELEDIRKAGNYFLAPFTMVIEDWGGESFTLPDPH